MIGLNHALPLFQIMVGPTIMFGLAGKKVEVLGPTIYELPNGQEKSPKSVRRSTGFAFQGTHGGRRSILR